MINFLNSENYIQKIQDLQQTSSNQIIISSPDEINNLACVINDLSKNVLINQIEEIAGENKEIFIGKKLNIFV